MKTNHASAAAGASALFSDRASSTSSLETSPLASAELPAGTVRVLVGIEVPAAALAEIEADWARVADAARDAAGLTLDLTRAGLGRLQQLASRVSGVAVVEPRANPFARWMKSAA
jgi:hypothetical protein